MRTNIMNTIKPKSTDRLGNFRESRPNTQTCEEAVQQPQEKSNPSRTTTAQLHNIQIESEEMPSCDNCGLVFENMHALHVKKMVSWKRFPQKKMGR